MGREFGDLMSSVSPCNRVGRILYHTTCDPFLMLSHALGTAKSKPEASNSRDMCEKVAGYLNEKVHSLSTQLIAEREQAPVVVNTFNLEAFERYVHPDLWETVDTLTFSTNDKKGLNQTESHIKEREVRIAYVICVIMSCATGGRCSVPLHTVLPDYIEATGGSSELISVLNKLGAVASLETLERHIVSISPCARQMVC